MVKITEGKIPNSKLINFEVMEQLRKVANDSFDHGDYLQSAMIFIQMIEVLLRMEINWFALINNIPARAIKRASVEEQSFYRLVLYLDLIAISGIGSVSFVR